MYVCVCLWLRLLERCEVKYEDLQFIKRKAGLVRDREVYQNINTNFVDVTAKMQRLADKVKNTI